MTTELFWLTMTVTMTALMWVPYILNRLIEQGPGKAILDPQGDKTTQFAWAKRMMQAHYNAIENLAVFAPLVLILYATKMSTEYTALACATYFYARLAHYLLYSFGVPGLRTPAFAIGFAAQMVLILTLLKIL
ncbi:MAG: MAPEG family protein [Arenicellales bacterium]